ncbi:MAG: hypothetical protein LBD37_05655, partial [Treponema sp.]|nr:hypothetical protein [Treponema sp.]
EPLGSFGQRPKLQAEWSFAKGKTPRQSGNAGLPAPRSPLNAQIIQGEIFDTAKITLRLFIRHYQKGPRIANLRFDTD